MEGCCQDATNTFSHSPNLNGMAYISRNFSIHMAVFPGVATIILNFHFKVSYCEQIRSFPLSFYKKKPEGRVSWQEPKLSSVVPSKASSQALAQEHQSNATLHFCTSLRLMFELASCESRIRKFTVSIRGPIPGALQYGRRKDQVNRGLVGLSSAGLCEARRRDDRAQPDVLFASQLCPFHLEC